MCGMRVHVCVSCPPLGACGPGAIGAHILDRPLPAGGGPAPRAMGMEAQAATSWPSQGMSARPVPVFSPLAAQSRPLPPLPSFSPSFPLLRGAGPARFLGRGPWSSGALVEQVRKESSRRRLAAHASSSRAFLPRAAREPLGRLDRRLEPRLELRRSYSMWAPRGCRSTPRRTRALVAVSLPCAMSLHGSAARPSPRLLSRLEELAADDATVTPW